MHCFVEYRCNFPPLPYNSHPNKQSVHYFFDVIFRITMIIEKLIIFYVDKKIRKKILTL